MPETVDEKPTDPVNESTADPLDELAHHLTELGAESDTARAVKRIVPWVGSILLHTALITFGFLVVTAVGYMQQEEEQLVVVADFDQLHYEPLAVLNPNVAPEDQRQVQDRVKTDSVEQTLAEQLSELEVDPISLISDAASRTEIAEFAPQPKQGTAKFAGLTGTNARRIVFIVDASGSMIGSLQIVVEELGRSLEGLVPEQSFGIIFFQRNEAIMVPPTGRLTEALPAEKIRALRWIDEHVIPKRESNPIEAIRMGLRLRPDVIFLLSQNITGIGQYEIDQQDLLGILDQLNPRDAETGRRQTQIQCVQFLDPDPLDTLRKIAEAHSGPKGYKFLDRRELGLDVK